MERKFLPDFQLLGICVVLIVFGFLILASVSASFSIQKTGTSFYFLQHQVLFGLLPGLLLAGGAFFIPLRLFKKWSFVMLGVNILLLFLVFAPGIGGELGGAQRWLFLGPFSFQPSEPLKLIFIMYVASLLARNPLAHRSPREQKQNLLIPFVCIVGLISFLLLLQKDLGTLGVIGVSGLVLYFLARTPFWHSLVLLGASIASALFIILLTPFRMQRLAVFLDPSLDPLGQGYQVKQALIGIGSGGVTGVGLGLSFQKFGLLPHPISDSIFAVFAEELGFAGGMFLILIFLLFCWKVFAVAKKTKDSFASLTAAGIGIWITFQTFINIGAMTGLIPLTGIPMPFVSYGGSALVSELAALGVLLNISRHES